MFEKFGIACEIRQVGLYAGTLSEDLAAVAPARTVPALRTPEGVAIGESLAIAETLAERHPDAGHWPRDAAHRATARWLCAEMATGFSALRAECPMQLLRCYRGFDPSPGVRADLDRLETLWRHARSVSGTSRGWLFGAYCLADVFFAPVAARVVGYELPVSGEARDYCHRLLSDPAMRAWRAEALRHPVVPEPYARDGPSAPWPAKYA